MSELRQFACLESVPPTRVNHDPGFNSTTEDWFFHSGKHGVTGAIIQWCLLHSSLVRYTLPSPPNSLKIKYYTGHIYIYLYLYPIYISVKLNNNNSNNNI